MSNAKNMNLSRRDIIKTMAVVVGTQTMGERIFAQPAEPASTDILIDPTPQHELSPYLFMQFMEPLGATDSSVEVAWDHTKGAWREDVVEVARDLSPTMIRWGGCFSSYYRWKEAVGPRDRRKTMFNLLWGGIESNQIGTAEFVKFCRLIDAEPLMCVNFESDGRRKWMKDPAGQSRFADAEEAAEWVRYCNAQDNAMRIANGHPQPHPIKLWQIGNETSYDRKGYNCQTAVKKTVEFAAAMRKADPEIKLIGWGDSGWSARMFDAAGEHLQYLAFHHMFNPDNRKKHVIEGNLYRQDPDATWNQLMEAWKINDNKIRRIRDELGGRTIPLAMTECHFSIPGRDRCDVLSTWATGASYARMFNNYQRHGDVLKIATAADFCGNRWQVNAMMIPTPRKRGKSYLMPVARVMKLYRKHIGQHAVNVQTSDTGLDVVASRTAKTVFLHAVNTNRSRSVSASVRIPENAVRSARMFCIAEDTTVEVTELNSDKVMQIGETSLKPGEKWEFPAASVCAVELSLV